MQKVFESFFVFFRKPKQCAKGSHKNKFAILSVEASGWQGAKAQEYQDIPSFRNVARRAISWIGVGELGYSGADVVRYLGVTNSCVTRMLSTGVKPDIDDIVLEL